MQYTGTRLREEIVIRELVTVHYFEFSKDYRFRGESHDFWEIVYADRGEFIAETDSGRRVIKTGDILFHKPNEWHTLVADGVNAPSAIVISFKCGSPAMSAFEGGLFSTGSVQRTLLSKILDESKKAFSSPLSDLFTAKLSRRRDATFGSEQMIKLHLTELLLTLLREENTPATTSLKRNLDSGLFSDICAYLEESVGTKLSLDDIARYAGISKTALKQLFREQAGCGACEYFTRLKIDCAKQYIREADYNFTQIAEMLGYDSIHYFSRQFRKYVNMSPTEYAGSIRALTGAAGIFEKEEKF